MKRSIKAITVQELTGELIRAGYKHYSARQVCHWLYKSRTLRSFDEMTNLPKEARWYLAEHYFIDSLAVENVQESIDGTKKILYRLRDGEFIESVLMPDNKKRDVFTLCVSTQVGCPMKCTFCLTAQMGYIRNLTPPEIIDQVLISRREFLTENQCLRNLVFMGMGEPLLNTQAVVTALRFLTSPQYCAFSPRRVTVSTVGIPPGIKKLGESGVGVNLALSLNATTNELRSQLMPINKKYPIESLIDACREFPLPRRRRITFEYVMLKDVNDTEEDARRLARLLRPIRAKVNLIVYNPVPHLPYEPSPQEHIERFRQILIAKNYTVAVRYSKGKDIKAACGQLAGNYLLAQSH